MIDKKSLVKISDYLWEIPKSYRSDMRVSAQIFASEEMIKEILTDRSVEQLVNVTTLPGIQKAALAMPDIHEGYGFPIGGVAATVYPEGVVSPGGIGYDINCGVRLLLSGQTLKNSEPFLPKLGNQLFSQIPSGVGRGGVLKLSQDELNQILKEGVIWLIKKGFGEKEDLNHIESSGVMENADPNAVSDIAKKRGKDQLGTMGAGNHFVEIDKVEEIFEEQAAKSFGLFSNQIVILIHTGSRGLGHQVATDYIKIMLEGLSKYKINVPDRELACAPLSSQEGTNYFNAMAGAANFAWANRQFITYLVRKVWQETFGTEGELSILYDVAHNIAKIEDHEIKAKKLKLIVHRKGATRSFGPNHSDLQPEYQKTGQPVIIPGSMGTASYVLVGTDEATKLSFGSTCHGAGRRMSRHQAKKEIFGKDLKTKLENQGILIQTGSLSGLAEEAPTAYKDIDSVVNVVEKAGIAKKVAKLKPLVVMKG